MLLVRAVICHRIRALVVPNRLDLALRYLLNLLGTLAGQIVTRGQVTILGCREVWVWEMRGFLLHFSFGRCLGERSCNLILQTEDYFGALGSLILSLVANECALRVATLILLLWSLIHQLVLHLIGCLDGRSRASLSVNATVRAEFNTFAGGLDLLGLRGCHSHELLLDLFAIRQFHNVGIKIKLVVWRNRLYHASHLVDLWRAVDLLLQAFILLGSQCVLGIHVVAGCAISTLLIGWILRCLNDDAKIAPVCIVANRLCSNFLVQACSPLHQFIHL